MIINSRSLHQAAPQLCKKAFVKPQVLRIAAMRKAQTGLVVTPPRQTLAHGRRNMLVVCKASGDTRQEVLKARYGTAEHQKLLNKAYGLRQAIAAEVVGQDDLAAELQDRLVQFVEDFGAHRDVPLALHIMGHSGVGKSAALNVVKNMGIEVVHIDAHMFSGARNSSDALSLFTSLVSPLIHGGAPGILLIDELDKIPETGGHGSGDLPFHPFMGLLNELLTDGQIKLNRHHRIDLSSSLIITTMNFAPQEVEDFAPEVLGAPKSYYDFTVEDFQVFDTWVRSKTAARAKLLSHIFRPNTVSRLSPNTVIVKPLDHADYRLIITRHVEAALARNVGIKKFKATHAPNYIDFLAERIIDPPLGARESVIKADLMTQQLINFALKAPGRDAASLVHAREGYIDVDPESGNVRVQVTAKKWFHNTSVISDQFSFLVQYDGRSHSFIQPEALAVEPPMSRTSDRVLPDKPPTRKEIRAMRFPVVKHQLIGLAAKINTKLIGQQRYTELIESDLNAYMALPGPVQKSPPFRIIAGFPGIGKSKLAELAGQFAGLPIARINLQKYSAMEAATMNAFFSDLSNSVEQARRESKNGKFIVLFEELDKIFEVHPQAGVFVDRPVMTHVKDLLNDGFIQTTAGDFGRSRTVDIRDAYNMVTMNFAVERFHFTADPRLTSIDDVIRAWDRLRKPAELKGILDTMFLPETVSRLLPRFKVMKPLKQEDYAAIITQQVHDVIANRFHDPKTHKNMGQINMELTPAYHRYLYAEAVIPSEGARNTVIVTQQRLTVDLEEVMKNLPQTCDLAVAPLTITLDFDPDRAEVSALVQPQNTAVPTTGQEIYKRHVELTFPPLHAVGPLKEERLLTAVHELGHLMTGVRLGRRFEYTTVVSPSAGIGGYVKFSPSGGTARDYISDIYIALGSRAMERMFLSANPQAPESVLDITAGASGDIAAATRTLWYVLYELGFDPSGGPIARAPLSGHLFPALPDQAVRQLQKILRQMEDYVLNDLCAAHSKAWYVSRVTDLARAGGMSEAEAYTMLAYPLPGDGHRLSPAAAQRLQNTFKATIVPHPEELQELAAFKQGRTATTAGENLDRAVEYFATTVREELHVAAR